MSAKIFPESTDIHQDQARLLYNYYRRAAQTIIAQEEQIEAEVQSLNERRAALVAEREKTWIWFLTIVLFFMYFVKNNEIDEAIAAIDRRIDELRGEWSRIFRDYRVTKMGVGYIPVAERIDGADGSFVVDYTGTVPPTEVSLQKPRRADLLAETIGNLERLTREAPLVETSADVETIDTDEYSASIQHINQHDYMGALERSLRTIDFCMRDVDTESVSLPLALRGSGYLADLDRYATDSVPQGAATFSVFDTAALSAPVERFKELNDTRRQMSGSAAQFEEVVKSLMSVMARSVQTVSALKVASVDKVVFESNKTLFQILKSPFNHYSPLLEHDEIERMRHERFDYSDDIRGYEPFNLKPSSRVKLNPVTGMWVAEDGSVTNMPFGVHQIYEEIVAPMVQNLMAENRVERLKIYNQIKDQKLSYLNKWHQDTEAFYRANRAESADIINLMQEGLREYVAAYNTLLSLKKTEEGMAVPAIGANGPDLDATVVEVADNTVETAAAFELQAKQFQEAQEAFESYMEQLKDDIDRRAEEFGHVEYYDAKLRDGHSHEAAEAAGEVSELDPRRRAMAMASPLLAKKSQLPPEPKLDDIAREHLSLNLPALARAALDSLEAAAAPPEIPTQPAQ